MASDRRAEWVLYDAVVEDDILQGYEIAQAAPALTDPEDFTIQQPPETVAMPTVTGEDPFGDVEVESEADGYVVTVQHSQAGCMVTQVDVVLPDVGYTGPILRRVDLGQGFGANQRIFEKFGSEGMVIHNPTMGGMALLPGGAEHTALLPSRPRYFAHGARDDGTKFTAGATLPHQFDPDGSVEGAPYNHGGSATKAPNFWRMPFFECEDWQFGGRKNIHRVTTWFYQPRRWEATEEDDLVAQSVAGHYLVDLEFNEAYVFDIAGNVLTPVPNFDLEEGDEVRNAAWEISTASMVSSGDAGSDTAPSPCPSGYVATIYRRTSDDLCVAKIGKIVPQAEFDDGRRPCFVSVGQGINRDVFPLPAGIDDNTGPYGFLFSRGDALAAGWVGQVFFWFVGHFDDVTTAARELYTSGALDAEVPIDVVPEAVTDGTVWPPEGYEADEDESDADVPDLVPEDGSNVEGANGYCTIAFADAYLAAILPTSHVWFDESDDEKRAWIMQAASQIDTAFTWQGKRTHQEQALAWPRWGVVDEDGYGIDSDDIPTRLQQANAYAAAVLAAGGVIVRDVDGTGSIRSKTTTLPSGLSTSVEYAGTRDPQPQVTFLNRLLAPLCVSSGPTVRLVRS